MAGRSPHISGVVARGDTLTIRLLSPEPDFLARIAEPVCARFVQHPDRPQGVRLIPSAGPYYVSSYTPGQSVVLLRNPNYRGSRPHHLERIEMAIGISSGQAVAEVQAGRADCIFAGRADSQTRHHSHPSSQRDTEHGSTAAAHGRQQYFIEPIPTPQFILPQHAPPPVQRRADAPGRQLRHRPAGASPESATEAARRPERPAGHYLPPGIPGSTNAPIYPLTPDLTKANSLTDARNRTAVLYTCEEQTCRLQAQIIKTELAAIGLRLDVKTFPINTLTAASTAPRRQFDLATRRIGADYPDPSAMLDSLLNIESFDEPTYRRRLTAVRETDRAGTLHRLRQARRRPRPERRPPRGHRRPRQPRFLLGADRLPNLRLLRRGPRRALHQARRPVSATTGTRG